MTTSTIATVLLTTLASGCSSSSPHGTPAVPTTATASRGSGATLAAPLSWRVVPGAASSGDDGLSLDSIACPSVHDCWAVGWGGSATTGLIEHCTGESWNIVPADITPTPGPGGAFLYGVACAGSSDCWAVGSQFPSFAGQALIEQYAGSGWSAVPTPTPSGPVDSQLDSVTCVSPSDCWAVGVTRKYGNGVNEGLVQGLIEHYTGGGWSIVASPVPSPGTGNRLSGVTCVSSADCWAVGSTSSDANGDSQGLVEQYSGGGWAVVTSPPPSGGTGSGLSAVACVSTIDCWAVGSTDGGTQGLVEQYAGGAWNIVTSPTLSPSVRVALSGVACTGVGSCWSAGEYSPVSTETLEYEFQALIEGYAGGSWNVSAAPALSGYSSLAGATCVGASDCWAVGGVMVSGISQVLIEHFS